MLMTVMKRSTIIAAIFLLSVNAYARANDLKSVTVPPGDLASALESLGKQFGVDVIYPSEQIRGLKTQGISGTLDVPAAFTKLLEGTSLTFRKDTSGAVLVALPKNGDSQPLSLGEESEGPTKWEGEARFAQANIPSPGTGEGRDPRSGKGEGSEEPSDSYEGQELPAPEETGKGIPEFLVTGSHIRGSEPAGAKVTTIDRSRR